MLVNSTEEARDSKYSYDCQAKEQPKFDQVQMNIFLVTTYINLTFNTLS